MPDSTLTGPGSVSLRPHQAAAPIHRALRSSLFWLLMACAATMLQAGIRIAGAPWYFFWDDTQLGAYGQWFELGRRLTTGTWTILDPAAWQGGNLLAEGQWGVWSPLAWLIAVSSQAFASAAVFATAVKIVFLLALCVGVFLLARDFGASPAWASVAGFGVTAGGQTIYLDGPSWVSGLQSAALFVITWWALRRFVVHHRSPLPYLIAAYLLVSVGYVFGVMELVVLFVFVLIEAWLRDRVRGLVRPLLAGVYAGLLTVFVYLPGILTSPVTVRSDEGIVNDQFLNLDLSDLGTSSTSTAISSVRGYWGDEAPVPLQYVTWLLPIVAVVGFGIVRMRRELLTVYGVLIATIAFVIGPSVIGPLRYPARMMPYVVICVMVLIAVLATRYWPSLVKKPARVGALVIAAAGAGLSWASAPANYFWVALGAGLQIIGLLFLFELTRRTPQTVHALAVPGAALALSVLVLVPQAVNFPNSPLGNFKVPSSVSAMRDVGARLPDGVMTVGDVYGLQNNPQAYRESLLANLWYVAGRDAVGTYTVLPFRQFAADLCIDVRGATCPEAFGRLFRSSSDQPVPLADDLHLNAIIVIKGEGLSSPPQTPAGWTRENRDFTWLYTRDQTLPPAGGVARTDAGTEVTVLEQTDTHVSIRVDAVGSTGGDVILSRMAWPGYTVSGGSLADSARGYLLTVDVPADARGQIIDIDFRPPGWILEVVSAAVAVALALGMSLAHLIGTSRRRRERADTSSRKGPLQPSVR